MTHGFIFTPELAALVLQTPIVADTLTVVAGSWAELTATQFHEVLLHFSTTSLDIQACRLRACQITDDLIRELSKKGLRCATFHNELVPVDGGRFVVTDDAVADFCVQSDEHIAPERVLCGELVLHNGSFTKDLFKRLVEASAVSMRTRWMRIVVCPSPVGDEDLRDFAQHLSYRNRVKPWQYRIYNFPSEHHGSDAAMHTQIVLHPYNSLQLTHAQLPHH
ncbi:hypothetical protein AAVH_09503 [Aphelenchoides avenae]|nr:hypothetical protein AAVH_09503 [Aphelenchus avenae]